MWKNPQETADLVTFTEEILKDYLRYKTITSQNVPSKAQIKNFFIL